MKERVFKYGTTYNVEVISSSKILIAVHAKDINEGFMLAYHGLKQLPSIGDKGKIVFERNAGRGFWQWYPETIQSPNNKTESK